MAENQKEFITEQKNKYPDLFSKLRMCGIGEVTVARCLDLWAENSLKYIAYNPYNLMEIDGIGFVKADVIARTTFQVEVNDPRRQEALILNILDTNKTYGNTYLPITKLEALMRKEKIVDYDQKLKDLDENKKIVIDDNRIYTHKLYVAEVGLAYEIRNRLGNIISDTSTSVNEPSILPENLDEFQRSAVLKYLNPFQIITGGPGTGKSFTTKTICDFLSSENLKINLCSPTGKAAKRLKDMSGRDASTIHRMLGGGFGRWKYNSLNKLKTDVVMIDESSMLDIELADHLFDALSPETKLIFIGDVHQLPPVGPGSFFKDIINSKLFDVSVLNINHRQGSGSGIADVALKINNNYMNLSFGDSIEDDIQFVEADSTIDIRSQIMDLVSKLRKRGYNYIEDMQIISPQHKTAVGVESINDLLRFSLNKNARAGEKFSVGDKVIQTVNNYDLGVFNGYFGEVKYIDTRNVVVIFWDDNREVTYKRNEAINELMLAYCTTVHKMQGSEAKCGIFICSTSHHFMLTRNLLYTAITRFKEKCVILGEVAALRHAVTNLKEGDRFSKLIERVKGEI